MQHETHAPGRPCRLTGSCALRCSRQQPPGDFTLLGAGLRTRPAHDGSNSQTGDLIPVVRYYGKPWFARTTQGILEGGARAQFSPGFALGAQLAYEGGRKTSESPFLAAGPFAQATWANRRNIRTFYGAPGFDPGGGLLYLSAGVLGSLDLSRHWVVVASLEGRRLRGDAARSPLAERRSNHYASAGLAYRF